MSDNAIGTILLLLALGLLRVAWAIFCITRGVDKTRGQRREIEIMGVGIKYDLEELYEIGNPFNKYNGRSNW